jgi:hypothetical protein
MTTTPSAQNAASTIIKEGEGDGKAPILTLSLQSRQQGRKVISIQASSTTHDLYQRASMEFGGVAIESIKGGFPPKLIPIDQSVQLSSVLTNQERLQVEFSATLITTSSDMNKNKSSKKNTNNPHHDKAAIAITTTTCDNSSVSVRKSKRAALKAATEAMPAVIKAQEEYLKSLSSTTSKKRSRPAASANTNNTSPHKQPIKPKSVKISASAGTGRRLADGATIHNPTTANAAAAVSHSRRAIASNNKKQQVTSSSTSDLAESLLGALNDRGQMGVVLRKGMKNAVQASYETSKAFSRLAAIQAKTYHITTLGSETQDANIIRDNTATSAAGVAGGNCGSHLKIVYHGSVDKIQVEEIVDCIPIDVLQAVLEGIHASDREALRPENLARLSPRVLWSCVHHHQHHNHFSSTTTIPEIYRQLLPTLDWSFLRRRAEQLSEKALENKRQAEEKKRQRNGQTNETIDMEQATEAIAAVEYAMEHLHDYQAEERKARVAQAALARLQQQQQQQNDHGDWTLTTPNEPDRDELRECIESSVPVGTARAVIAKWITQLMKTCRIHNWRELANVMDGSGIATQLGGIPEEHVQAWIDHAQSRSVEEIIVEICDGNVQAVEIMTERARCGTPKDLALWRSIPDVLLQHLLHNGPSDNFASGSQDNDDGTQHPQRHEEWMELGTITKWCNRSYKLLGQTEWLNWYATPIA